MHKGIKIDILAALFSVRRQMGMKNVLFGKRRKTSHCLIFEHYASINGNASQPDGKEFNSNNFAVIEQVRMAVYLAKGQLPRKSMKSSRKRLSPEELAVKKKSMQYTLKQRRNAICTEIERRLFLQGASLEKHRHNFQVTHDLTARGLMW